MKLSHGDSVIVTAGKDKGKKGTIMRVLAAQNRVIVSGANMVTKHVKKSAQEAGKKIKYEVSLHASNVAILDPKTGKPTRIGYRVDTVTGKKTRIAKGSGVALERSKVAPDTSEKVRSAPSATSDSKPGKKSPFWKKVGFGSDVAASDSDAPKGDSSALATPIPAHRSGGRGS